MSIKLKPFFEYPAIGNPSQDDVYQAVELVKSMADIAALASTSGLTHSDASVSALQTIERNLRFASKTLEHALMPFLCKNAASDEEGTASEIG